jgi:hypothetical protein
MTFRTLLGNIVNALDFAQGRKTKIGAFIVLVGKVIHAFNPDMGDLIVQLGEWFALYGLALVAARQFAPPKPGEPEPIDPLPEKKLGKEDVPYEVRRG